MHKYAVDPVLVQLPSNDAASASLWLASLQRWLGEVRDSQGEYQWLHFYECTRAITEAGRYPDFVTLRSVIDRYDLDFNAAWLTRELSRFFQDQGQSVASACTTLSAVAAREPEYEPAAFIARNAVCRPQLQDEMLVLACDCCADGETVVLVTAPLERAPRTLVYTAEVELIDPPRLRIGPPTKCVVKFPLVYSPDELTEILEPRQLFSTGPRAVRQEILRRAGPFVSHELRLGDDFLNSVWTSGLAADASALRAIVRAGAALITDTAQGRGFEPHFLRVGSGRGAAQRVRGSDGATAWRLKLTQHGAGWRLHYWHLGGHSQVFELANVVTEQEANIIE